MKTLNVTRPDGKKEIIDVTEKFEMMNQIIFNKIKNETEKAGRGTVNEIMVVEKRTNVPQLRKEYNDLYNEGAEGYIPDELEYWTSNPRYKEWDQIIIYK